MRSKLLQQVDPRTAIAPQLVTLVSGAKTITGDPVLRVTDEVALGNARSALIVFQASVSSGADMVITPEIHESDASGSGFAAITPTATLPTLTITSVAGGLQKIFLRLNGMKAYMKLVLKFAGTDTDTATVSASIILGDGSVESLPRGTVPTVYAKA
jgi:hypothetical protein